MDNPFHFFNLKPALIVDSVELRKLLIEIQRKAQNDPESGEELAEKANIAYKKLLSPELRVISFLNAIKSTYDWTTIQLDAIELMDFMDLSDQIEDAVSSNSQEQKQALGREINQLEQQMDSELESLNSSIQNITQWEENQLHDLARWIQRFKYIQRLKKNLDGEIEI